MDFSNSNDVQFSINGVWFEYDIDKNRKNINKHGLSLRTAARVFFDYNRVEFYDDTHSVEEDRYNTIGDIRAGEATIGRPTNMKGYDSDLLFVVYTERQRRVQGEQIIDIIRIISARIANSFERGVYYGNQNEY